MKTRYQITPLTVPSICVITGFILAFGVVNLSAAAAPPAHRGKVPDYHHRQDTKTLDLGIIEDYEAVAQELVRDDLNGAKKASSKLAASAREEGIPSIADTASKIVGATNLEEARGAFKTLSAEVINRSKGKPDYTVMACPMVENGRWLQSGKKVANPYMGSKMPECGMPESMKGMMMGGTEGAPKKHGPRKFK